MRSTTKTESYQWDDPPTTILIGTLRKVYPPSTQIKNELFASVNRDPTESRLPTETGVLPLHVIDSSLLQLDESIRFCLC